MKGRAQKGSINRQEKLGGRVQKTEKYMIFDVLVPEMEKLVIFVFTEENILTHHITSVNARFNVLKDITLTTQCFFVCFIFIGVITTSIL